MARPVVKDEDNVLEKWEITTGQTVWVWTWDRREDRYIKTRVGGRAGSKRLSITRDDRKYNQEQVTEEMATHDPFTNGTLVLVDTADRDESLNVRYHLTQEDLVDLLGIGDQELFKTEVTDIKSELLLRRLFGAAEKQGQMWQVDFLRDLIEERYRAGGSQRTYREMEAAGDLGTRLS